jgi:hypothetical protein
MLMIYYHINILLHEIALHDDHPAANFKPPYFLTRSRSQSKKTEKLTAPVIDAVMQCVTFSHDFLDTFLSLDVDTLRALPVYKFVMVCYAVLVLKKLTQSVGDPESEIGKVLDHNGLAFDLYSDAVVAQITKAAGPEEFGVPSKFLNVVLCIRSVGWHPFPILGMDKGGSGGIHPLRHLSSQKSPGSGTHSIQAVYSGSIDERSPASGSTDHASLSVGTIPSSTHLSPNNDAPTMYSSIQPFARNIDGTSNSPGYPLQYSLEQRPASPSSPSLEEMGIYESDMATSFFSELAENAVFTEDLHNWMPPASVTGHTIDQQMLDTPYWGFSGHPHN